VGRGGLVRLVAWHLPGGLVGPSARWTATSNVAGESGTEEGPLTKEGGLSLDKLFAGARVPSYATAHEAGLPNYPRPV